MQRVQLKADHTKTVWDRTAIRHRTVGIQHVIGDVVSLDLDLLKILILTFQGKPGADLEGDVTGVRLP